MYPLPRPRSVAALTVALALLLPGLAHAQGGKATLKLQKGDRIVFVGNTFAERMQHYGYFETLMQSCWDLGLTFRNLAWSGDEVGYQPRPLNFGDMPQHLTEQKADVIFLYFGMNESFKGQAGLPAFEKDLEALMRGYLGQKFNGKTPPRLVLVSPIAHERLGGELPDPTEHNKQLKAYTDVMRRVAERNKVPFIDLFTPTLALMNDPSGDRLTINGIHLTQYGYWAVAQLMMKELGHDLRGSEAGINVRDGLARDPLALVREPLRGGLEHLPIPPPPLGAKVHSVFAKHNLFLTIANLKPGEYTFKINDKVCAVGTDKEWEKGFRIQSSPMHAAAERLRLAIVDRNQEFFYRWRAVNGEYIYGRRAKPFGVVNFPDEMKQLDEMVRERDGRILSLKRPPKITSVALVPAAPGDRKQLPWIHDQKLPEPKILSAAELYQQKPGFIGGQLFPTAADPNEALKHFKLAEGYQINLFASEKDFPLENPVAMAWDTKGRLWVCCSPSYPQYLPGHPPNDRIIVLEDTDGDGKADKHTVFADRLYLPIGLEFADGGVYVSAQPNLLFLKDTDGDGKADVREVVLHGFGTGDSHHSISAFTFDPGGALYLMEGTFHRSMVETPHGPVRLFESGVFRYEPKRARVEVYVSYPFANPWGHCFDRWGQNFIADASGGANYFALPLTGHVEHPRQHPPMKEFTPTKVRPTCGCELVSSRHFPASAQGNFLINNCIGFQGVKQYQVIEEGSGFTAKEIEPLLFSTDRSFRPVALQFGPDGALYVCDWHNPLVGHMQHSIRDPGRDHIHGRIYRITYRGNPLVKAPKIAGEPIPALLDLLKTYEDRTRYRVRMELRERGKKDVAAALKQWIAKLDHQDAEYEHHLLEALWVCEGTYNVEPGMLRRLLRAKDYRARAAATRVLRNWRDRIDNSLSLLEVQVKDEHPRVRLEAVVALSFFQDARAAEIALLALQSPTDYYLDYGLRETMVTLEPYWKAALTAGKPFATNNPAGAAYILGNVATADLVKMPRSAPVYVALLTREHVPHEFRHEALSGLARLNKTDVLTELFGAIERLDKSDSGHAAHVLHDLAHILTGRPPAELQKNRPQLEKLAAAARLPVTRQVAYVSLVTADGSLDRTWAEASKSVRTLRDFLDAVPLLPDPKLKAAAYDKVRPLVHDLPESLKGQVKSGKSVIGRYIRIELPGNKRTLTLAEVQVFSNGVNIALRGKAAQSSTVHGGVASRAIDGNTSGAYGDGGQTHTAEGVKDPWWEVDLGSEQPIEVIVVWNRSENNGQFASRLDGYTLTVLDAGRRPVLVKDKNPAPATNFRFVFEEDPAGAVRRSAIAALTAIPGHDAELFSTFAELVRKGDLRDAAVRGIRRLPPSSWPRDQVRPLLNTLVAYLAKLPASERAETAAIDALQLGNDLATLLPADEAKKARVQLRELGVNVVLVRTVPHKMAYDRTRFYVEAGKPVVVVLENTDIMPHNLLITAPGALAEIGMAAERMATDPDALAKNFIPKSAKVLHATPMLQPSESARLYFVAPKQSGDYPYVCTFPGHWLVMNGTMKVVKSLDDVPTEELNPVVAEIKARPFVRNWSVEDLAADLDRLEHGRSFERGKELFKATSCVQCHKMQADGGIVGPDLTDLPKKLADKKTPFTRLDLLREVLEPSKVIHPQYKNWILETGTGELVTGVIVFDDGKTLKVVTNPLQEPRTLPASDVASKREAKVSLMPQGLLVTLTREEILDLLAYLAAGGDARHPAFTRRGHEH